MVIRDKKTFYRLSSLGLCGNTPMTWNSHKEFVDDNGPFKYSIVGLRRTINAHTVLTPGIRTNRMRAYIKRNQIEENTYVITTVPNPKNDHIRKIQGELSWVNGNWYLFYTHKGGYMRIALRDEPNHAYGWRAIELLKMFCSDSDYQDILSLFHKYTYENEYPVIEFSVTVDNCGRLKGRNTIIWEIRHY